jgi:hypothetical protein
MYLAELIIRKNFIKQKIAETRAYLSKESNRANVDNAVKNLLKLLDNLKSHLILIDDKNINTTIELGGAKISVSNAVRLRQGIERKISLITELIENNECGLDIFSLMGERDKLNEEHILIEKAIQQNDWTLEVSSDKTSTG